jgi:MOSC domain-containing protein YiiM
MVYQLDSYRYWERELNRTNISYGQFGENLTVDGLPDVEVCVGDCYRIGTALFEVSQPRVTCYRVGDSFDGRYPRHFVPEALRARLRSVSSLRTRWQTFRSSI